MVMRGGGPACVRVRGREMQGTVSGTVCGACGRLNSLARQACKRCGADLDGASTTPVLPSCERCAARLAPTARFCGYCGWPVADTGVQPAAVAAPVADEVPLSTAVATSVPPKNGWLRCIAAWLPPYRCEACGHGARGHTFYGCLNGCSCQIIYLPL
jgi:hypothetical protein